MKIKEQIAYIYIITDGTNYKVGVTKKEPEKRLKQLQTGNPKKLKIFNSFKVPIKMVYQLEKEAHNKIKTIYPKFGEWFHGATAFHINLLVDEICQNFIINNCNDD